MRKLNTGDAFKMARLMKSGNIIGAVKEAFANGRKEGADDEQVGMDFMVDVLCVCAEEETETQIYDLLAGICEKKPDEIRDQSLEATAEDIRRIIQENNIVNFFRSASRLSAKIQG